MKPHRSSGSSVLTGAIRLALAAFWLYAGGIKLVMPFDARPFLDHAVVLSQAASPTVLPVVGRVVAHGVLPVAPAVNLAIPVLEIAIGLGFLLGLLGLARKATLAMAATLSLLFIACGANGLNPLLLAALFLLALNPDRREEPTRAAQSPSPPRG